MLDSTIRTEVNNGHTFCPEQRNGAFSTLSICKTFLSCVCPAYYC